MGWERRNGRMYLYRNRRVNGRPVKEYLAAEGPFGDLMEYDLERVRRLERKLRRLARRALTAFRTHVESVARSGAEADAMLKVAVETVLTARGFYRHHRGEWRKRRTTDMRKIVQQLREAIEKLKTSQLGPMINFQPPADDPEAVAVFTKARAGDAAALAELPRLVASRKWADWIGDLGKEATHQLIHRAASGDAVWKAGITAKVNQLRKSLLGEDPTPLDELLVRRIVNAWVTVHALELEQVVRPSGDPRAVSYLDRRLTQAQRRLTDATRALAAVRRTVAPRVAVQAVNAVVNA